MLSRGLATLRDAIRRRVREDARGRVRASGDQEPDDDVVSGRLMALAGPGRLRVRPALRVGPANDAGRKMADLERKSELGWQCRERGPAGAPPASVAPATVHDEE